MNPPEQIGSVSSFSDADYNQFSSEELQVEADRLRELLQILIGFLYNSIYLDLKRQTESKIQQIESLIDSHRRFHRQAE